MVRTRSRWLAASLVVGAMGLTVPACKKNEDKKDPATGDKTTEKTPGVKGTDSDTPVNVKPITGPVGEDLKLLPAGAEVVFGLNFDQLRSSALWKQVGPKIMDKAAAQLADFKAACGFDPFESIKTVMVAMRSGAGNAPEGGMVLHGLEKSKVMGGCADKVKVEAAKKNVEVTIDGDVMLIKDPKGNTSAMTFINDNTLLATIGSKGNKDGLAAAAKGTEGLNTSAAFVDLFGKINTADSVYFLVNGNAPSVAKGLTMLGAKPKALYGSVNVQDGLAVDLRFRMSSADEATQFVKMKQGDIANPQIKQMVDKLELVADGADAKLGVAMSQEKLNNLMMMAAGMIGGMMGGAAGGGGMGGPPGMGGPGGP